MSNLKALTKAHKLFDGTVTVYMMPYRTMNVDIAIEALNRQMPMKKWVHGETGEETYKDPHATLGDDKIGRAQRENSKWDEIDLWADAHNLFCVCDPLTVDIEFADELTGQGAVLQTYWQNRNGSMLHNWELFTTIVSRDIALAWFEAYEATRDTSMDGPLALQDEPEVDADPEG